MNKENGMIKRRGNYDPSSFFFATRLSSPLFLFPPLRFALIVRERPTVSEAPEEERLRAPKSPSVAFHFTVFLLLSIHSLPSPPKNRFAKKKERRGREGIKNAGVGKEK